MRIKFTVNEKELRKELIKSTASKNNAATIKRNLKLKNGELVYKKIERLKKEMIQDFLNLPITKEIMAGPKSQNISGTLRGYGNLFSFIGFNQGDDPIAPIINLLNQTSYEISRFSPRGKSRIRIIMPSKNDIFDVTPIPWAPGLSWAQRIEVGMPGFGRYLSKQSSSSRSGTAIQSGKRSRTGSFKNSKYISHFLSKWQKVFLNIEKKINLI